jgi:hypothetical protein
MSCIALRNLDRPKFETSGSLIPSTGSGSNDGDGAAESKSIHRGRAEEQLRMAQG